MTEAEWQSSSMTISMLQSLRGIASERKLRLASVAACRQVWALLPISVKGAIPFLESYADGAVSLNKFMVEVVALGIRDGTLATWAFGYTEGSIWYTDHCEAVMTLLFMCKHTAFTKSAPPENVIKRADVWSMTSKRQAELLRDIFGNPFQQTSFDPTWRTSTVDAIATQIYDTRDFSPACILADALEEAGCQEASILDHLRCESAHVRGCWVIDLILGKA